MISGYRQESIAPYLPASYTLEKDTDIKSFVICSKSESIIIPWVGITDHFQIAMIKLMARRIARYRDF